MQRWDGYSAVPPRFRMERVFGVMTARGGTLLQEITVMVVSYAQKTDLEKNMMELRVFLHRFGREANQGEVGLIISGNYYGISEYDKT